MNRFMGTLIAMSRLQKQLTIISTDFIALIMSFFLAVFFEDSILQRSSPAELILISSITVAFHLIISGHFGIFSVSIRYFSKNTIVRLVIISSLTSVTFFFSTSVPYQKPMIENGIIFFIALLTFSLTFRLAGRFFLNRDIERHTKKTRIAIFGVNRQSRQLLKSVLATDQFKPSLFIDDNEEFRDRFVDDLGVYSLNKFKEKMKMHDTGLILVAKDQTNNEVLSNLLRKLEGTSVKVKVLPSLSELINQQNFSQGIRDISLDDLLGRPPIPPISDLLSQNVVNQVTMVTGAGGTIGSELCRQIINCGAKEVILVENSEYALYQIYHELNEVVKNGRLRTLIVPKICSVQEQDRLYRLMNSHSVETVYHAAAYKHVPLVELNPIEAIKNNVFGTHALVSAAINAKVKNCIIISTDKAVQPTNVMGATKRLAELICQSASQKKNYTNISIVRFGNVIGSSGSVIPLFQKQIARGGPLTVTHRDVSRYFMTTEEAAQLVMQAGAMSENGGVFVLDMGQPVKILELAKTIARMNGLKPIEVKDKKKNIKSNMLTGKCIEIKFTGLRAGEKLHEELFIGSNGISSLHPRIMIAKEKIKLETPIKVTMESLENAIAIDDHGLAEKTLTNAGLGYKPVKISKENDS